MPYGDIIEHVNVLEELPDNPAAKGVDDDPFLTDRKQGANHAKSTEDLFMEVKLRQAKDWISQFNEGNVLRVEYTPIIMTKGGGFTFD